ncbi:MAG: hypothetical protein IPO40_10775 [Fibrobacteres bacterium]|nr:hypothetical protein [Fibrobacterota bacterium]
MRDALGADPAWMFGGDGDSSELRWERSGWLKVRRPVRFQASSEQRRVEPCVRKSFGLEACGGWSERDERMSLGGKHWSLEGEGEAETSSLASLSLGPSPRRITTWMDHGKNRLATGVRMGWGDSLWRVDAGAQRVRSDSRIQVRAREGAMELEWPSLSDSVGLGAELPLGAWTVRTGWWRGERRSPERGGDQLADSIRLSGWEVGARRAMGAGRLECRLWREDRQGILTGFRDDDVFLDQVLESSRAEMSLRWRSAAWDAALATRQFRLESPQGRLDHPTIHWNRLAQGDFAPFASLLEDRSDYVWGSLSLEAWEASGGRVFRAGKFSIHPVWRMQLITLDAKLQRIRLTVKTFFPSTTRDTLAMGTGWIAMGGPKLSVSRVGTFGRFECQAGIRLPFAGDWEDLKPKIVSTATPALASSAGSGSLPIDPLGSWEWGVSWGW